MPDLWMDVDAALSEVPVNIMPLLDDTDFKTRETGITFDQAGMDLVWNFVTTGGAFTQTAVTPTSAGNYDWTNQGDGMYTIEIPASGGASINNNTEGFGWFTGFATGILPWRGPVIGFRAAALNNSLIDGATIDVNVTAMAASVVTAAAIATDAIDSDALAASALSEIKTQITDALNVDTYAEPGQEAPPATTTLVKKIGYLYKAFRNRITQTSTTLSLFADNASTVDQKATVSDDATTYDRGELASGP